MQARVLGVKNEIASAVNPLSPSATRFDAESTGGALTKRKKKKKEGK
jgi:hypothetical protein